MRRILDKLYLISGAIAAVFIAAIVAIVFFQVCFNLVDKILSVVLGKAIGLTIPSYSDFTGFFLAAASFFALAYTLNSAGHIRVTLVINVIPKKIQALLNGLTLIISLIMCSYATWYTISLVLESYEYGDMTSGMASIPLWIPQTPVALGLIILTIALLDNFIRVLSGKIPLYEGKNESLMSE